MHVHRWYELSPPSWRNLWKLFARHFAYACTDCPELNAALIVQELLNRGQTSMDYARGLRQVEGGWTVWWRDQHWYVTTEEARLGKGGTVGAHHEVMV